MKYLYNYRNYILILLVLCFLNSCKKKNDIPLVAKGIIPIPAQITTMGRGFLISEHTKIIANTENLVELANVYAKELGVDKVEISQIPNNDGLILSIDTNLKKEGYSINISPENIMVKGGDKAGIFYALQSLNQLKTDNSFPGVTINDAPQFTYRGMMLDVSRYFYPIADVKKFLDIMALHKYNKFHWHLTDDQGWRIEIKKYPKLTEIGSIRKETMKGDFRASNARKVLWEQTGKWDFRKNYIPNPNDYDGKPHGGFYTQEDIKEIVQYAASKYIEVIPEIDVPGHFSAALAAYPEFGCKESYEVATRWGVHPNILCPTKKSINFVKDVLIEVMELFPSNYVHIGGDEANKTHWEDSKFCQDLIREYNLEDEMGLQSYFIGELDKFLTSKGKSLIGWDEILEGGLSKNATVMSWRGELGGIKAAKQNHNVIMSPGTHTYFDKYQDSLDFKQKTPLAQWGVVSLKKTYSYNPLPKELSIEEQKYILGAEGCMWTEYIPKMEHLEYMALPRLAALSEVLWSKPEKKNWGDFNNRLKDLINLYEDKNYNYAKNNKRY
ncbi:beta-N-acetylhexosaminidase [Algibacter mikhailovii]|nr:beta-N-acetylhexosaminidase [Algibacter mikhailovii]